MSGTPRFRGAFILTFGVLLVAGWTLHAAPRQGTEGVKGKEGTGNREQGTVPIQNPKSKIQNPDAPAEGKEKKPKMATITGDDWTHDDATGIGSGRNVRYVEEDTSLFGEKVRYNQKKKLLDAEGNLVMDDFKHHITGDKAVVDNGKKKLAVITGNVVVTVRSDEEEKAEREKQEKGERKKEKGESPIQNLDTQHPTPNTQSPNNPITQSPDAPAESKERKRGAVITCDRIDYYYSKAKKFAILRGHLVVKQRFTDKDGKNIERTLTAEHAEHDGKTDRLLLFGPVDWHDNQDQKGHFDKDVLVGTKEGAEFLESKGKSSVITKVDEEEEESGDTTQPTPTPAESPKKPNGTDK